MKSTLLIQKLMLATCMLAGSQITAHPVITVLSYVPRAIGFDGLAIIAAARAGVLYGRACHKYTCSVPSSLKQGQEQTKQADTLSYICAGSFLAGRVWHYLQSNQQANVIIIQKRGGALLKGEDTAQAAADTAPILPAHAPECVDKKLDTPSERPDQVKIEVDTPVQTHLDLTKP